MKIVGLRNFIEFDLCIFNKHCKRDAQNHKKYGIIAEERNPDIRKGSSQTERRRRKPRRWCAVTAGVNLWQNIARQEENCENRRAD